MFAFLRLQRFSISIILLLLVIFNGFVGSLAVEDDSKELVLTTEEKDALYTLKRNVIDSLPEEWMKTDFYLLRWIRMANLDVPTAQNLIKKMVDWRRNEKISEIVHEDFSDIASDYKMTFGNATDFIGRPVGTIDLGSWDLRAAVLQGRQKRLQRYLTRSLELGVLKVFRAQEKALEKGNVVTQGITLIDAEGGNLRQHLCPRCLAILIQWLQEMENYYPRFVKEIIMFNSPSVAAVGLKALMPFMSPETKRALKMFDAKKHIWTKKLDSIIPRNQRTRRYGGTRPDH